MNSFLYGRNSSEIKQNLDINYQAMKIQDKNGNDLVFGNEMYNKLVYFTYNALKSDNFKTEDVRKIAELSDRYMHSLISIADKKEEENELISKQIARDNEVIENLAEELFFDSPKRLNENQYSALRPVLQKFILKKSTNDFSIDKEKDIASILKELNKNDSISEKNFNDIYDFLSDEETFEMLKYKIALAKSNKIINIDLFEKQEVINNTNHELFDITKEVTDLSDITTICEYIIASKNLKPIETEKHKVESIKSIVNKWALNIADDKTKQGDKKTSKFIFELENLYNEDDDINIKLTPGLKKIGLDFAEELDDLSKAVKKYFGINLNDSGIKYEDLINSNNDAELFNFVNNLRENLKMEAITIKTNSQYFDDDSILIEAYSLLGKKNKLGTDLSELSIIQSFIKNANKKQEGSLKSKKEVLVSILKDEHSHISDNRLHDLSNEKLLKKKTPNSDLSELDNFFTEGKILPLYTNDEYTGTPITKYIDMKDKLSSRIYFNFAKKVTEFHKTFKTQNPSFYKSSMEYLFLKKKNNLNSKLMIKSEEMIICINEGQSKNKQIRKHKRSRQKTR